MIGRSSRASLLIVGAALAAGCLGEPTPSVSAVATGFPVASVPSAAPSQGAAPSGPVLPAPPIAFTELTCGDPDDVIPIGELQGPGGAESGLDPEAAVLRTFLEGAGGLGYPFPATGWYRVASVGTPTRFLAPSPDGWLQVVIEPLDGTLQASDYGACQLAPRVADGQSLLRWWLDPSAPPPAAGDTAIQAIAVELACANGERPTGRQLPPIVTSDARSVVVTLVVRRLDSADCPGNPTFPLTIGLPEPLGARQLLDGSTFPAAPPSEP